MVPQYALTGRASRIADINAMLGDATARAQERWMASQHGIQHLGMMMKELAVARVILYVKDVSGIAAFYQRHFAMKPIGQEEDGWIELASAQGGCNIALHKAASSQKSGAAIKIVFGVADVARFKAERASDGLNFGPIHEVGTFAFANAKDPAGNSIQISSRGMR